MGGGGDEQFLSPVLQHSSWMGVGIKKTQSRLRCIQSGAFTEEAITHVKLPR